MDLPKHRGRRPHNALSAAFVRTAKPGYYCDGNGLYLRVDRSGARRWEQRLQIQGRPRTMGLGGYQLVSLAEAREKAFMNRKIARSGGDPRIERHKVRDMPTFAEAAARVLEQQRAGWRTAKHAKDWVTALPHAEVAGAIEAARTSASTLTTRLAFEFLVLTACRSSEVRLASWDDINLETAEWTIPAERMKAQRPHRVPLSGRAMEILSEARTLGGGGLVFPSPEGRVFSDTNLPRLLRGLGIAAVPHGFRSSFRDWAAECTDTPHAVMEAALAHVVRNKAEAAYARSDLFERRRVLMANWAAYLTGESQ